MKKILLFSFFIFSFSLLKAQWVTIPDANFRNWLNLNGYASCMNGTLMDTTCPAIVNATNMNMYNQGQTDITGIRYFDNLTSLNCDANQLTFLPLLPNTLITIFCSNNPLASISAFPASLKNFHCVDSDLTSLPPFPNSLLFLDISYSPYLNSLPALPNSLTTLNCYYDILGTLPTLPNSITTLNIYHSYLFSLPALPNSLIVLNCQDNNLYTLPALPNSLTQLSCYNNQLTSLPALPPSMSKLLINDNPGIKCLPTLINYTGTSGNFNISNTGISCISNSIQHSGFIAGIDNTPICNLFYNPNNCEVFTNIMGSVFSGYNSNCLYDTGELLIHHEGISLYQSGTFIGKTYSDAVGNYGFGILNGGNYDVIADTTSSIRFSCPTNGSYNISVATGNLVIVPGIELECDTTGFDIGILGINHGAFGPPGHQILIHMLVGDQSIVLNGVNCNSIGLSGEVKVIINGPITFLGMVSGGITPTSNSGDTIIWDINDFSIPIDNLLDFYIKVDTQATLGTPVCFDIEVTPTAGDIDTTNNTLVACGPIISSMDPNTKEVQPTGTISTDYDGWLTYTIHFQNTGTAYADHVKILDTIDTNLNASTFEFLASDHNPAVQVMNGISVFNFQNINLADSSSNEPDSHGWVMYRIKQNPGIVSGSTISNDASIYFDYNSPVVTNTVNNQVCNTIAPTNISQSICNGEIFDFNGQQLSAAGNYSATLNAVNGCDSIINLALDVLNPVSNSINQSICDGEIFDFNGQQLSAAGNYSATLNAVNGCDSVISLSLSVISNTGSTLSETICTGDVFNFNGANFSSTGIYIDTVSAFNTCDSIITLNLTVEIINATIQQASDTLSVNSGGTIQWFDCNTQQIISGATGNVFIPTTSGMYAAIITEGNCSDTTTCTQVFTGINEFKIQNLQFTISPNPTDESITIQLSQPCTNCQIEISNTLGQILISDKEIFQSSIFNLQSLPAGIYFVALRSDRMSAVKKLVKQ